MESGDFLHLWGPSVTLNHPRSSHELIWVSCEISLPSSKDSLWLEYKVRNMRCWDWRIKRLRLQRVKSQVPFKSTKLEVSLELRLEVSFKCDEVLFSFYYYFLRPPQDFLCSFLLAAAESRCPGCDCQKEEQSWGHTPAASTGWEVSPAKSGMDGDTASLGEGSCCPPVPPVTVPLPPPQTDPREHSLCKHSTICHAAEASRLEQKQVWCQSNLVRKQAEERTQK